MEHLKSYPDNKKYYSSHGISMPFSRFIEIEIEERENYEPKEIRKWMKKYNIDEDSNCIWVTEDKWMANFYNLNAEEFNDEKYRKVPEDELEVTEIDPKDGFIIPESDDGDNGYLFIYY